MNLFSRSRYAYQAIQSLLDLPHSRTVKNYFGKLGSLGNFTECSEVIKKMLQKLQGEKTDCQILPDERDIKPGPQYQSGYLLGLSTEDDPRKPAKGLV